MIAPADLRKAQNRVRVWGGEMPRAICPVCDARVHVSQDEAVLFERVECPECGALLEVVEEAPLELGEVSEE